MLRDYLSGKVDLPPENRPFFERLYRLVIPTVRARLGRTHAHADGHAREVAIEESWLEYLLDQAPFRASGQPLGVFLLGKARGRLADLERGERRRHLRVQTLTNEELEKSCDFFSETARAEVSSGLNTIEDQRAFLDEIGQHLPAKDRERLSMCRRGASVADWAHQLKIAHLPRSEQCRRVRNAKHSLIQKVCRIRRRMERGGLR